MSNELIFLLCFIAWLVVVLLISRAMRINGSDHDAQQAADSVRQSLDADSRFDELLDYTGQGARTVYKRPHIRAFSEPRT